MKEVKFKSIEAVGVRKALELSSLVRMGKIILKKQSALLNFEYDGIIIIFPVE